MITFFKSVISIKSLFIKVSLAVLLASVNQVLAAYTFSSNGSSSGAPNCTGNASGVYNCTSGFDNNNETTTINNASGPVTINITGAMRVRKNISIASPNHVVTINVTSNLRMNDDNNSIRASDGSTTYTNVNINVGGNTDIVTSGSVLASIKATSSGRITLGSNPTIYGSLTTTSGNISAYGTINGSLVSTTGTITKDAGSVSEAIITTSGAISLKNQASVKHITCDCALTVAYGITVTGNIQVASMTEDPDGSQGTYSGSIYTTTGGVKLRYSSDVAGSITSATTVNLADQNTANSCVKSTSSSSITLAWGVHANSVCCGSSCSNSCVTNNTSYAMPPACTTEQVVINARGDQFYGTYPIMELWVNGTKYGSVSVTNTDKDYFFNIVLPATITSLDVVFPNDEANSSGDRNLILNTVTIRGKTLRPTDSGVILDRGDSSSYPTFFDGVDTVPGQVGIWWEAAVRFVPSFTGELIAAYQLDETSWDGTTNANEPKDTASYTSVPFDGQGIGSPKPTASTSSPARSGATGTCGYATFTGSTSGGSAFTFDGLPVSTTTGAKTSVSFWMYWDGNTWKMPVGWNKYNLVFGDTYFGFNTSNSDLYGMSSSGLANGWHHVVAVFTNGNVSSNKIYIDGVNKSLTQKLGSPANQHAVVQSTLQVSGWTNPDWETTNYRFTDSRIDEVKIYNGEVSSTQVTSDYNATHACPVYVSNVNANSFNCTASQESNVASGRLYTQMAGSSFDIKVIALKTGGTAAETSFSTASSRDVTLKFIDQTNSSEITFNDGSDKTSKTLTFPAGDTTGVLSISGLTINNAFKNLKCQIYDATASTPTSLSNDSFSVRPYQLVITSTNATDSTSTSATNTQKIIAGANFNLTATAKNSSDTTLSGYNGTPSVSLTSITHHTGAIVTGTLSGSFSSAASSGVASANFTYSEVGYFKLNAGAVTDTSFIATVDSAANGDCTDDFSVTAVSGKYGCKIQNISESSYFGRFIPERFNVDDASVTSSNACGSFSYYGQDGFNTQFILRAQNTSGGRTRNYHGSYAKLDINTWTDDSALTGLKFLATNLPSGVSLLAGSSNPTGSWSEGQATVYATHKLSRPTNAVAPVNLILNTNPLDNDGVYVINHTPEAANIPANSLFRYGRLWVPNLYGSELLNLTVPIEAQYWSSNNVYQRNQLDSCTAIAPANIAMGSYKGNLTACETEISGGGTMSSGKTTMTLSKPGNGNNGSVDLSINLNSAAGSTCILSTAPSATNANLPQFGTSNPTARETFGLFKSPVIYMRENY